MDITITPTKLNGIVSAIPSKSQAHRLLILAAFANAPTTLVCPDTNRDIEATIDCLRALGADIQRADSAYRVIPCTSIPRKAVLNCCESGSTLRFMLPIAGALGVDATFLLEGRLPCRPLSPLWEEMERMGCTLTRPSQNSLRCLGKLKSGVFCIDGGVSSQFVTGLLLAGAVMRTPNKIAISGKLESRPYVEMTQAALSAFGVDSQNLCTPGTPLRTPGTLVVEGDWSNGAFFLAATALGGDVKVTNLDMSSAQGDKAAASLIKALQEGCCTIDAADIPDLVPILSVVAASKHGAVFENIQRLRLKESDRVSTVIAMLHALGGRAEATATTLKIFPRRLHGGIVDAAGDHRIAMSAAIAATAADSSVTILGAQCVSKSYPRFWEEYKRLGGCYEQHIR